MSQKNETPALLLAFLITAGIVGGVAWWLTQKAGVNLGNLSPNSTPSSASNPTSTGNQPSNGQGLAQVQNVPNGLFSYGGSTSWAPIRGKVDAAIQQARPEFRLRYVSPATGAPGSASGIRMLIRDELDFVQSSRSMTDQEFQQAQQRGVKLKQVAVAIDALAVAVNPSLNVSGITIAQLEAIYTGSLTNWQQIGGPNLPIQPISRPVNAGGTVELFVEQILKGRPLATNVQTISTTTEALRKLASTPGAIYFASAPEVVEQCTIKPLPLGRTPNQLVSPYQGALVAPSQCPGQRNQLNATAFRTGQYPLTRNLFVVIKQNGQVEEQAGSAYANLLLSAQGQELISETGFVRIR